MDCASTEVTDQQYHHEHLTYRLDLTPPSGSDHDAVLGAVHVAALAQFGARCRVDRSAEGADPVEARLPQGAGVLAEEGEHQRFLGLEHLKACEGDEARDVAEDGDDEQEAAEGVFPAFQMADGIHKERCARRENDEAEQQHREAAFFGRDVKGERKTPRTKIRDV